MNLATLLCERAAAHPDRLALIDTTGGRERTLTYAQLDRATGAIAARLRARGPLPGDAVLLGTPMSLELYVATIGTIRAGCAALIVDPAHGHEALARAIAYAGVRVFLATPRIAFFALASPALRGIPHHLLVRAHVAPAHACAPVDVDDTAAAILSYTSGSTGEAKLIVRTHGLLRAQLEALRVQAPAAGGINIATMPVAALANIASGVTTLIPDIDLREAGAAGAKILCNQIESYEASGLVASPALLARLVRDLDRRGASLLTLERVYTGGGPVFPELLQGLVRIAPWARITALYGATEAEPIALLDANACDDAVRAKIQSGHGLFAGRPAEGIALRILRDDGTPCAMGERGEIAVCGERVAAPAGAWHRTGDAGYLDPAGGLWLLGRMRGRVRAAGHTLYPFALECVARGVAGVERSAAACIDGRVVLFVEASGNRARVAKALEVALAGSGVDRIAFARIPLDRRHHAKIDYTALGELAHTYTAV